ncbi:MAG: histidine phosphotransferase family protein [Pseudomonadota bacterium]
MTITPTLSELDLAALLCSKVCHDIISPVGAITNGLEVLDEEGNEDMKDFAMDLIRKSAVSASAKLTFARLAFGASGSAGASIDTGDAQKAAEDYMAGEKAELEWSGPRLLLPKNKVKLLLNLLLVAAGAVPRGGSIKLSLEGAEEDIKFTIDCTGPNARVPAGFLDCLNGTLEGEVDAHAVQPYYTVLLSKSTGMELSARVDSEAVVLTAG